MGQLYQANEDVIVINERFLNDERQIKCIHFTVVT